MARYHQGLFRPKHPEKYRGDPTNIVYRSRWELVVFSTLDESKNVISWGSEEVVVPYVSPVDGKRHRYFPDIVLKKRNHSDGRIETVMIEIKPEKQTKPPLVRSGRPSKKYLNEVKTWGVNSAKFEAAHKYCERRGWKFVIFTEKDIGLDF